MRGMTVDLRVASKELTMTRAAKVEWKRKLLEPPPRREGKGGGGGFQ